MPQVAGERRWRFGWIGIDPPWSEERRARLALLRRGWQVAPRTVIVLTLLVITEAVLDVGRRVVNGAVVGAIPAVLAAGAVTDQLERALLLMGALYLAGTVVPVALDEAAGFLANIVDHDLRLELLDTMNAPVGIAHLETADIRDEVARAGALALFTPGAVLHGMAVIGYARLMSVGSFLLLARFRLWLAVLILGVFQVVEVRARRNYMETARVVYGQTQDFRRSDYVREVTLGAGAKETRLFGLPHWMVQRYRHHWLGAMAEVWADRAATARYLIWVAPTLVCTYAIAGGVIGRAAFVGEIGVGELAVLIGAVGGTSAFVSFGLQRTRVEYGVTAFGPMLTLAGRIEAVVPRLTGVVDPTDMPTQSIRFENVSFRYPGSDRDIYDRLDLELPAGKAVAIVGVNGAGKTTLCKLLARCYEPIGGRITVDGIDLAEVDPLAWQRRIAAIFQDFIRFPLSAADNIGFGAVEHLNDMDAVRSAASDAGILDVVEGLPRGWDTLLDRRFTDGAELSGGESQRIALARALFAVRGGASVLILDEPTASLDVRAEAELFDRYIELTRGTTSVLISHRFSTVRHADVICVLDGGRVTEQGTHDELVGLGGRYAEMFHLQASHYRDAAGAVEEAGNA